MTDIYVDADACPVREEIYRVAARTGLDVLVVHNGSRPIRPPEQPGVRMVIVPDGPDAADDWIAERITPQDICVTGDIPLAKRCLDRGARALDHKGQAWTDDNIGNALAGREIARHMRESGLGGGGHAPLTRADRSRFLAALDAAVIAARRAPAPGRR
ncbi:MAG: YaiI/YqxD family protein [Acetobacteraceae bacterium]